MISLRRALIALALTGVAAMAAVEVVILTSHHMPQRGLAAGLGGFVAAAWIFTGLFAWYRRPNQSFGPLMTAAGFLWCLNGLQAANASVVFTVASAFGSLFIAATVHLLLSATRLGAPPSRAERATIIAGYASTTILIVPAYLFAGPDDFHCTRCPDNAFLVRKDHGLAQLLFGIPTIVGFIVLVATGVIISRRVRRATPAQRRALAPVTYAGTVMVLALALELFGGTLGASHKVVQPVDILAAICFASIPIVFLVGLLRARVSGTARVGELVASLNEAPTAGRLRELLAEALGDRSLDLAYWLPEGSRWINAEGHAYRLPDPGGGRAVLEIERDGERVGAIVHDAALLEQEPELVRAIGAAAGLALENERLAAELKATIEELRASRARIVEAGDRERRRLERNLHDGAQQRLVALSLALGVARSSVGEDPERARRLIGSAQDELGQALAELRELARGIHPALLADHGLDAAVETLAGRAPLPVDISIETSDRLPEPVEAAAYFVVAEALTNVAKYASASRASVSVARVNGAAVVEVSDDGVGGADPKAGTGLSGLADRVAALDGRLRVASPLGGGTTVKAEIPCG